MTAEDQVAHVPAMATRTTESTGPVVVLVVVKVTVRHGLRLMPAEVRLARVRPASLSMEMRMRSVLVPQQAALGGYHGPR